MCEQNDGMRTKSVDINCLIGYNFIANIKNLDELNQEILLDYEKSRERLEDEEYIILLLKLGYRVPKKFIAKHHPNLIGKKFN